jgi:hypothetical protein
MSEVANNILFQLGFNRYLILFEKGCSKMEKWKIILYVKKHSFLGVISRN